MNIRRISYLNFRNIQIAEFFPGNGFNVLWGDNAQGKTNFLEGIYLLANLKSFRNAKNEDLILQGTEQGQIKAEITQGENLNRVEVNILPKSKSFKINQKFLSDPENLLRVVRAVLFSPEEMLIIRGSPAGRRAFLDRALFQSEPGYLKHAQNYEKILRQRNQLLRQGSKGPELTSWTTLLIQAGAKVRWYRCRFVARLLPFFKEGYRWISEGIETINLNYTVSADDEEILHQRLAQEVAGCTAREFQYGQTLAGPHRDDLTFDINERGIRQFASQGQLRSALLAFKTAQLALLEAETGRPPLLLLDDMSSELDRRRKLNFFEYLKSRKGQVFITTTDLSSLLGEDMNSTCCFQIQHGTIHPDTRSMRI